MNAWAAPSPWFVRHARSVREAAALGPVVDLACGRGRHALAAISLGARTLAVDRDRDALVVLLGEAQKRALPGVLTAVRADLENALGFPLRPESCGAILVFRYLHRPLAPALASLLRPGGLLLYETFTKEQRNLGYGPSNPAFLLAAGELRDLFPELETLAYEEGLCPGERPEALARLAARRSVSGPSPA